MILLPRLEAKPPSQAQPGELIAFELRSHRALGIVLSHEENQTLIGLVQSSEQDLDPSPPFAFNLQHRAYGPRECLSFGQNWVLELMPGGESVPASRAEWATSGVVYLSSTGPTIFFTSLHTRSYGAGYTFNLSSSALVEDNDRGTPHLSWRIWGSEADRDHPARDPLVTFQGSDAND